MSEIKGKKYTWNLENSLEQELNEELILKSFWFNNRQEYKIFQNKTYKEVKHHFSLLNDYEKFLETLKYIKDNDKSVLIFWDYDADWITGAAVFYKGFLNYWISLKNIDFILPNRDTGYSIQFDYIKKYLENQNRKLKEVDYIITVDCWINSWKEIDLIKQNYPNIQIWVTDHHSVKEPFSNFSLFNINPNRIDSTYPFKAISGSVVALKLMEGLYETYGFVKGSIEELEDIACIGSIADVMPIKDENFYLARDCLKRFHVSENKGIDFLTSKLGNQEDYSLNSFNCDLVWMRIAPRINAVWRIDDPRFAFYMLINEDKEKLNLLFNKLDETNTKRKEICDITLENLEKSWINNEHNSIILEGDISDWIIGLMAWKIKEKYNKPTICFTIQEEKDVVKCSWRSVENVNLLELVNKVWHFFKGYGWHKWAFWWSMDKSNLESFKKEFYQISNSFIKKEDLEKKLNILGKINIKETSEDIINLIIKGKEPFWNENKEKNIILDWQIVSFQINNNKHTFINLSVGLKVIKCIFWNEVLENEVLVTGNHIKIAGKLQYNYFNWKSYLQLIWQDYLI